MNIDPVMGTSFQHQSLLLVAEVVPGIPRKEYEKGEPILPVVGESMDGYHDDPEYRAGCEYGVSLLEAVAGLLGHSQV